jgi:predicted glycosyltransferase
MKVLFDVNHAAHVHFIRNAHRVLSNEGFECLISASDKPLVYKLLTENNLPFYPMGRIGKSMISKLIRLVWHDIKLLFYCIKNRPKLIVGIVAIRGSHVGWLLRIKSIVFSDTETAKLQIAFFKPFANEIHNPEWFKTDLGPKQIRYKGFHELAYLHPNNFSPKPEVLSLLGLAADERFFIVRFVAWDATHDINQSGISLQGKRDIIDLLSNHGRVFVTSEYELEEEFKSKEFSIPSSFLHDAMYYASIVIGEGATTACEAAVLGTPSIYMNSIRLGYISYLESEYDLLYHLPKEDEAIRKLTDLVNNPQLKKEWEEKKNKFMNTQIDTSEYLVHLIKKSVEFDHSF